VARIITVKPGIIGCGGSYNFTIENYKFTRARNNFTVESYNITRARNNFTVESYNFTRAKNNITNERYNFTRSRNNVTVESYNFTDGYYIKQVGCFNNLLWINKFQAANCFVLWACCSEYRFYIGLYVYRNVDDT